MCKVAPDGAILVLVQTPPPPPLKPRPDSPKRLVAFSQMELRSSYSSGGCQLKGLQVLVENSLEQGLDDLCDCLKLKYQELGVFIVYSLGLKTHWFSFHQALCSVQSGMVWNMILCLISRCTAGWDNPIHFLNRLMHIWSKPYKCRP